MKIVPGRRKRRPIFKTPFRSPFKEIGGGLDEPKPPGTRRKRVEFPALRKKGEDVGNLRIARILLIQSTGPRGSENGRGVGKDRSLIDEPRSRRNRRKVDGPQSGPWRWWYAGEVYLPRCPPLLPAPCMGFRRCWSRAREKVMRAKRRRACRW
jgi:hypothetical protein